MIYSDEAYKLAMVVAMSAIRSPWTDSETEALYAADLVEACEAELKKRVQDET